MPKGPQGQKRPADAIGGAVLVGKIATGEEEDAPARGKTGGDARAASLTPKRRSQIAQKAAKARWSADRDLNE